MVTTGLYAGILALIYIALSVRVVMGRMKGKVALGHGSQEELMRRIRVHGNFIEYVPFALILMMILDMQYAAPAVLHGMGVTLIVGRLVHAYAITKANINLRKLGMVLTLGVIVVGAALGIWGFFAMPTLVSG